MRLIDADKLSADMYHEAFVKDSDMQKWDSGCWIRYKMFENVLKAQPTVEPEVISKWKKEFREYVDSLDIARDDRKGIIEYIDELPSAQPKRKTGRWIPTYEDCCADVWVKWKCSECGYVRKKGWKQTYDGAKPDALFCEMCNADMRGDKHGN